MFDQAKLSNNADAVPLTVTGSLDLSPTRIGRRMVWCFTYADGSSYKTYSTKKGFEITNKMMKAGVL